jgi:hypothetical protein
MKTRAIEGDFLVGGMVEINIFDNFVFFACPPFPHSLLGDFTVSEGRGYPLVV